MNKLTKNIQYLLILIALFFLNNFGTYGQTASISLGPDKIALNQTFTITLKIENERLKTYNGFPEIKGFRKLGTSSSSSTNFINGQMSFSQSITQNYQPLKEGVVTIPAFEIEANGKKVRSSGKKVVIGPAIQRQQRRRNWDPFEDFFNDTPAQKQEFEDVKADAFIAVTTDKKSVYLGEGFNLVLAFYVLPKDDRYVNFSNDISEQMVEIRKKLKPEDCWEEDFAIDKINRELVSIGGKRYYRYKIFESTFFPLTLDPINIPSIKLTMVKLKLAKQRSFFGRNYQQEPKEYFSKPKRVTIKDLPPHPLKQQVAVGNYRLKERIDKKELTTDDSFSYSFKIQGEGNISAIIKPVTESDDNFDIYPPNINQNISRANGRVTGSKNFSFYGIPKEPGDYDLSDYFQWIYFNPTLSQYDTLKSSIKILVTGESKKNAYISSNDMGRFYDSIELKDNTLKNINANPYFRIFVNIFLIIVLIATGYMIFRK